MSDHINAVAGPLSIDKLGKTLMHEHVLAGMPGWETDSGAPTVSRREMIARGVDRLQEAKAQFSTMVDPCPIDLGRDVELMAEMSSRSGFNIICATGLYTESWGASTYWNLKRLMDPDSENQLADLMIREIEVGIGETGIKAGIIKVATDDGLSDYEKFVFRAAARAAVATGVPVTTHTPGRAGDQQVAVLTQLGVPAHQIIVGHCCGNTDIHYHQKLMDAGAYIGFDQFGIELRKLGIDIDSVTDDDRTTSLLAVVQAGGLRRVVISHDSVMCQRGRLYSRKVAEVLESITLMHFSNNILPKLLAAGMTSKDFDVIFEENPHRYFSGAPFG